MISQSRLDTISTIRQLSCNGDGYNLYEMSVEYDYDLDELIAQGLVDDQTYAQAVFAQVLPGIEIEVQMPSFACSAFRAVTREGVVLTGRNYDFRDNTSSLLTRCSPKNGYRSIAFACLNNLRSNDALASKATKAACLMAPFACLDGVNERGVSIAVLTLDSAPTHQVSGRQHINTALAIRLVLDRAASTQEAVELLARYDMHAMADRDYHFFLNDASGDSRAIEYDPYDPDRPLIDLPVRQMTNFFARYQDMVLPNQKNGILGHGKEREEAISRILDAHEGNQSTEIAWQALKAASQEPNPESITSTTQWSIVYDNTNRSAQVALRRRWGDIFRFTLEA